MRFEIMGDQLHITETVAPADQAAVGEAVRDAGRRGLAVYPEGGGTMSDYGATPRRPGIGLSTSKLNRLVDYPAADMTITVEAGMTMAELTRQLAAQGQRLPVDVAHPDRATVGGALAADVFGPRRYAYGTMRDYVLGLSAVDGTGMAFHCGGRVVKNAAGYNLCRLMAGSLGTLGVVTQATLMVRPRCEASVFLVCEAPDFEIAEKLLVELVASPARPAAIEFVAGRQRESDLALGPMLEGNVGRLYVGFEGPEAEVDWMVEQLRDRWIAAGATAPMVVPTNRAELPWRQLAEFAAEAHINVLPGAVVETISKLMEIAPDCAVHAHAGNGVIRIKRGDGRGDRREWVEPLRTMVAAVGGKMTLRNPIDGIALSIEDAWGPRGAEFRVMQAIKDRFDPENILNPGRFIFA